MSQETTATPLVALDDLIHEDEVYAKYGKLFAARELCEARNDGKLAYYKLRKGIFYTEAQLLAYIEQRKHGPWENKAIVPESERRPASGNTKASGSQKKKAPLTIIDAGTAEKQNALLEKALEPRF